jgi:hypothetical protein
MRAVSSLMILITLLGVVGCGADHDKPVSEMSPEERKEKEPAYIALQQERVKKRLKDPGSAQFRKERVYYAIAPIVCGEVNSKNSFGAYSGFERFVSGGTLQVLESDMSPGEMDKVWERACK